MIEITDEEIRRLGDFLYRRTGMVYSVSKRYYIERRIADRANATASPSFERYFAKLRIDAEGEIEKFINAFTVNETYFNREDHQFRCLTKDLLRERIAAGYGKDQLRLWSVPCATGEEPYSIAMWLLDKWPLVDAYSIEICGSDIDTEALAAAKRGFYDKRALMRLPGQVIDRYFHQEADDRWRLVDELRESVQFSSVNLIESNETRHHGQFDIIFCRNVLIYFDDASRRIAADNLYESLLPGGYICLGHTESMSRISPLFEIRRFEDGIVYQKPEVGR
ncbi:chemotaxis protein [Mesorhizobium sp. L2C085B000]|uniref:CheR family methyltransferase n=1 Tax=unclassified Mesorhizobium TaxID=325217 RepID=UPI0003CFA42F|nr:chemotaxis protein [Mesorhizobium sp. L2C085B000]